MCVCVYVCMYVCIYLFMHVIMCSACVYMHVSESECIYACVSREVELMTVDEDVEEGARDLLELNDEGNFSANRKRGRGG